MPAKRFPPDDPREWLNRAKSNLVKAQSSLETPAIYLEDLCFDAKQAAEKAIKAVLIHWNIRFPYIHNLTLLLDLVAQTGQHIPETVRQAATLTDYAVTTRYPGPIEPVTPEEYEQAITIATAVVSWAGDMINQSLNASKSSKMD